MKTGLWLVRDTKASCLNPSKKKENPTSITLGSQLLLHKDLAKVFKDRLLEYIS